MKKKLLKIWIGVIFIVLLFSIDTTFAVPPPDFIIQIASQIGSFFAIWVALTSGLFSIIYQFIKHSITHFKKTFWFFSILFILLFSGIVAYFYDQYYQKEQQDNMNNEWLMETRNNIKETNNKIQNESIPITPDNQTANSSFYDLNHAVDLKISNEDFNKNIGNSEYIILDARENLEYEIGHIPNSKHIRFADLKAWRWEELPTNKIVYILCWSWMRGKEVASYLNSKKIVARYLEKWVDGWVSFWWNWQWEIKFSKIYNKESYQLIFTTKQVKDKLKEEVVLVDSRDPEKFQSKHIEWAINIPLMYTPSGEIEKVLWQIKKESTIIVVCDDYINCFDAKLTGIELEKRGIIFLWRYNKPWEF